MAPTGNLTGAHERASIVHQRNAQLKAKFTELDKFLTMLKGTCPVECARGFVMTPRHGKLLVDCGVLDIPNTWLRFKKAIRYWPYSYCYCCGMPLGAFEPSCYKSAVKTVAGMSCLWDDYMVSVVHTLWHTPSTHLQIITAFKLAREKEEFSDEEQSGQFINCLEVFLWYCHGWAAHGHHN